ncbi:viral intermediate transcription factor VITF-3 [Brazilian porcupinepox virus 1]|nr:viral intermediate transcription factor VITF-3 [Brazilian porcupinepox virus 1]
MDYLFEYLYDIQDDYSRTIFNFHLVSCNGIYDIYSHIKRLISEETIFNNLISDKDIREHIKKIVYCDINITKHIVNDKAYPIYTTTSKKFKSSQFFDIKSNDDELSMRTTDIFKRDKSSLISYIRTTNKKRKVDYGEIKKTVNCNNDKGAAIYFSGKKSDDYLLTTIKNNESKPWIKTISKHMRIDILHNSIVTKGKSSILQTIEIIFVNRTCIKIFKDSTMHFILSKDKSENNCISLVNKLFDVYRILFCILYNITKEKYFNDIFELSKTIISCHSFKDKIDIIRKNNKIYGINNFKIGMFNLTYKNPIDFTVFPSMLDNNGKIKFFKGKKLNIVALKSLDECKNNVILTNNIMKNMYYRSNILNDLNIESVCIEKLKELLI